MPPANPTPASIIAGAPPMGGAQPPAPAPPAPVAPPIAPPIAPPVNPQPAPAPGQQPAQQPPAPVVPGMPPPLPGSPAASQQPDPNAPPAWADNLLQTVTGMKTEFDQFRNMITEEVPQPGQAPQPGQVPAPGQPVPSYPGQPVQDWRPKTGAEIQAEIDKRAAEIVNKTLEERDTKAQQQTEAYQQEVAAVESNLDAQEGQLQQLGYLPAVANPNDPNDPGRAARAELYGYAMALGTTNLGQVAQTLKALHDRGQVYDSKTAQIVSKPSNFSPGAAAPIAGGTPSGMVPQNTQPNQDFFGKYDLDTIAEIANRAIQ